MYLHMMHATGYKYMYQSMCTNLIGANVTRKCIYMDYNHPVYRASFITTEDLGGNSAALDAQLCSTLEASVTTFAVTDIEQWSYM